MYRGAAFFTKDKKILRAQYSLLIYFAAIGMGFMFIEISQMQRLTIFLGHPVYGLSVVLFTLLLSCGIGSFLSGSKEEGRTKYGGIARLSMLALTVAALGSATPTLIQHFQGWGAPARILLSVGLLSPMGIFMGMAFPLGMRLSATHSETLTPWLWGINGAASVYASVLSVIIAISFGVSASFWTGLGCYAIAWASFFKALQK